MDRKMTEMLENLRNERKKIVAETRRLEAGIMSGTVSSGALDDYIEELRALRMRIHHCDTRIEEVTTQEGKFTLNTRQIPNTE